MTPVETATHKPATVRTINNFIGGEWRESSGKRIPDRNPANATEVIGEAPASNAEEAAFACESAARAFEGWRATPAPKRGQLLYAARGGGGASSIHDAAGSRWRWPRPGAACPRRRPD